MAVTDDILEYLTTTVGVMDPIRIGGLPPGVDLGAAIFMTGGPPAELAMGLTVVERKFTFQIFTRAAEDGHTAGEALAEQIQAGLQAVGAVVINATNYDKIVALGEVSQVSVDDNDRPRWSASYEIWKRGA